MRASGYDLKKGRIQLDRYTYKITRKTTGAQGHQEFLSLGVFRTWLHQSNLVQKTMTTLLWAGDLSIDLPRSLSGQVILWIENCRCAKISDTGLSTNTETGSNKEILMRAKSSFALSKLVILHKYQNPLASNPPCSWGLDVSFYLFLINFYSYI